MNTPSSKDGCLDLLVQILFFAFLISTINRSTPNTRKSREKLRLSSSQMVVTDNGILVYRYGWVVKGAYDLSRRDCRRGDSSFLG